MNAQTQKVDVLAVIRSRANRTDCNGLPVVDETLLEACAAVAELIDTLRNIEALTGTHGFTGYFTKASAIETLRLVHQRAETALRLCWGS